MPRYWMTCKTCGARLEADSEEEMAKLLQEHVKDAHDTEISDEEALSRLEGQINNI